ncbi:unnamed protein product [Menidia menidia]|uniref:(Atlantic silverside) hypothetical protein n=1 Tax=Menidia menidia TaxID=238744 RepID=A0A8S4B8E4_9TELE|nr:unnamed protein product [Menidia menidia]
MVVEQGVAIQDTFAQLVPPVNPAQKIILSQVPPFISLFVTKRYKENRRGTGSSQRMKCYGCGMKGHKCAAKFSLNLLNFKFN